LTSSRVTPHRVYLIASGWQRRVRDHRGDRQDPRDTGTRRGQTAPQRLSEPQTGSAGLRGMGRIRRPAVACACSPLPRVGGLVARKPIARRRRWEAVPLRQRRPHSPLAHRNRDHTKRNTNDRHTSQRRTRADRIRDAHRRPCQRDHRRRTRHRPPRPRRPRIRAPVDLAVHGRVACLFHLSQHRQAARDDAVFNELIARLDEEDDDSDG
jgi:hypothetical protein